MKMDLVSFLETNSQQLAEYEPEVVWDKRNSTIELTFRLFAENQQQFVIDDVDGTETAEEVIEFEDGVLFYWPGKSRFAEADYVKTIPFDGKKGLPQNVMVGILNYLAEVLANGQSDLLDFLTDEKAEIFELHWDEDKFQQAVAATPTTLIPYPSF